ncbi:MAG: futalosine hydrolase [Desulfomonilaceae bacterium]|nr:futalosine hydrolase [Desulfomonilaceae bacterium]
MNLWVVAAVENELNIVRAELSAGFGGMAGGHRYYRASWGRHSVYLGVTGVGIVSAAVAVTAFACTIGADRIIMIGSAGAYPGSGLQIGDVAVASSETFSELGVREGPGIGNGGALGVSDVEQTILLDKGLARDLAHAANEAAHAGSGRFLTVAGVSEDLGCAATRDRHFGALVENMEGYALASAGQKLGIEVGEVRGISNYAGNRDKGAWNLDAANERAQAVVPAYLRKYLQ